MFHEVVVSYDKTIGPVFLRSVHQQAHEVAGAFRQTQMDCVIPKRVRGHATGAHGAANVLRQVLQAIGVDDSDLAASLFPQKANGLVEVEKIMDVSSRLIVHRGAYKTRAAEINPLLDAFREALV